MEVFWMIWAFFVTLMCGVLVGMIAQNIWLSVNGMLKHEPNPKKPWWWPWK
jgi:hypothetical protein